MSFSVWFLSISVHFCPFLSVYVRFCLFLYVSKCFCLFLSISVHFCPLPPRPRRYELSKYMFYVDWIKTACLIETLLASHCFGLVSKGRSNLGCQVNLSTFWSIGVSKILLKYQDSMTYSLNHKAVSRTSQGTPGL